MPFTKFVQVGRVVYNSFGPDSDKIATIVDIIDENRVLIEGPFTDVPRQSCPLKRLQLTKFRLRFPHSAGTACVSKAWAAARISQQWEKTNWAKKLDNKTKKAEMTDFDRFKLMLAKQARNKALRKEFGILKRRERKLAPKPKVLKAKK